MDNFEVSYNNKLETVFILGAGFTNAILNKNKFNPPLLKDLSLKVTNELRNKFKKELDGLLKVYYDDNRYVSLEENIEIFLTYLDLLIAAENDSGKKENLERLRNNVEEIIVNELKKLNPQKMDDYNEDVVNKFLCLLRRNDTIITFNYDTCLETLLWLNKKWSPNEGYFEDDDYFSRIIKNKELLNIQILKLHGSINFVKADYYNTHGKDANYQYKFHIAPQINDSIFPGINANHDLIGSKGSYIIAPSYFKVFGGNYRIYQLWQKAYKALSNAFRIVIIGYSFPEADVMSKMLFNFVGKEINLDIIKCRIIIVSPEAEKIWNEIRQYILIDEEYINKVILNGKLEDKIDELKDKIFLL